MYYEEDFVEEVRRRNDIVDIMQKRVVTLEEGHVIRDDKKGGYEYERD